MLLALLARLVVDNQLDADLVLEVPIWTGSQIPEHVGPLVATGSRRNLEDVALQSRFGAVPRVVEEDLPLVELYALLTLGGVRVVALTSIERNAEIACV